MSSDLLHNKGNFLKAGEFLYHGDYIVGSNGNVLNLQRDGNLVFRTNWSDGTEEQILWQSNVEIGRTGMVKFTGSELKFGVGENYLDVSIPIGTTSDSKSYKILYPDGNNLAVSAVDAAAVAKSGRNDEEPSADRLFAPSKRPEAGTLFFEFKRSTSAARFTGARYEPRFEAEDKNAEQLYTGLTSQLGEVNYALNGAVIIVGSLFWDGDGSTDPSSRAAWRQNFLDAGTPTAVEMPIAYGRTSGGTQQNPKRTTTMVLLDSYRKDKLGSAWVLGCRKEHTSLKHAADTAKKAAGNKSATDMCEAPVFPDAEGTIWHGGSPSLLQPPLPLAPVKQSIADDFQNPKRNTGELRLGLAEQARALARAEGIMPVADRGLSTPTKLRLYGRKGKGAWGLICIAFRPVDKLGGIAKAVRELWGRQTDGQNIFSFFESVWPEGEDLPFDRDGFLTCLPTSFWDKVGAQYDYVLCTVPLPDNPLPSRAAIVETIVDDPRNYLVNNIVHGIMTHDDGKFLSNPLVLNRLKNALVEGVKKSRQTAKEPTA